MVIILAWIIRGERKYDRSPPVRPCAGIVFRAGPRKSDELIERAIIGRLKTVTRRAVAVELAVTERGGKHVEQFSISDQRVGKNFLGSAINIARHFDVPPVTLNRGKSCLHGKFMLIEKDIAEPN